MSTPTHGYVLYLYLAVSDYAVSSVLIKEENGQQRPIYYTSKILLDAETRTSTESSLPEGRLLRQNLQMGCRTGEYDIKRPSKPRF
ncbi:hypothetical protein AAC387_Pa09g0878 [Persea americana]